MKNVKNVFIAASLMLLATGVAGQIGVGTTTPNSTLDVRGSLSTGYRAFTASTSASISDNLLVFTGTSAVTLTLPTAVGITGRSYVVKNASTTGPTPVVTVATTSSQTIDGASTYLLDDPYESIQLVSDGANWKLAGNSFPASTGSAWSQGGNGVASLKTLGTTSNFDLPFITNNTEKMRLTATGRLGLGTSTFDATNPEKLLVDAGTTTSFNVISGKGTINNYLQLNIQNKSNGSVASSDVVATSDNGNETVNYVDMGINSSGYSSSSILGGANTAYLYTTGSDFAIGDASSNKDIVLFTGGTATTNERMRILGNGFIGMGTSAPNYLLHMHQPAASTSNWMQITNAATGTGTYDGFFYGVSSAGQPQIWGEGDLALYSGSGTTNNLTMTLKASGDVGIGSTSFDATNPEQLLVDAGNTSSFNVISGKGSINNYLQLNIQNRSSGGQASSDLVATSNNGNETVNYVDLGINSSGYSSSGILGGSNNAYLYATGNDFIIGNATASKDLVFFTGGTATGNERMRITSTAVQPGADNTYSLGKSGTRWSAVWSANGTIQTSDARLKTNIQQLAYGLNDIMKLRPVRYNWKENPNSQNKIGLIAQEVRRVIPEVVIGDEQKENLGMNYAELVPVLISAIQDLKKELDALKKQLAESK